MSRALRIWYWVLLQASCRSAHYSASVSVVQQGKGNSSSSSSYNPKAKASKGTAAPGPKSAVAASNKSISGFGGTAKKGDDYDTDGKPEPLEGWVEKKGGGRVMGENWQKRYLRIDERHAKLAYHKTSR
jgi:hypothetical protein